MQCTICYTLIKYDRNNTRFSKDNNTLETYSFSFISIYKPICIPNFTYFVFNIKTENIGIFTNTVRNKESGMICVCFDLRNSLSGETRSPARRDGLDRLCLVWTNKKLYSICLGKGKELRG